MKMAFVGQTSNEHLPWVAREYKMPSQSWEGHAREEKQPRVAVKSTDCLPGFKSQSGTSQAVWLCARYLTSLGLHFPTCQMGRLDPRHSTD